MIVRVLWITNILFPDICDRLGVTAPVTGGWMKSSAQALMEYGSGIELAVATLHGNSYSRVDINGVVYYCLPFNIYALKGYEPAMESYWQQVADDFHPDIVHIHGTEYPHGLAYMRSNGATNVVVSIQGLVGAYARYSLGQIPEYELRRHRTFYDLLRGHLLRTPWQMAKAGQLENEYLLLANHVIGRTDWDRDHVWAVNPKANYHFCNETLRSPFYTTSWTRSSCEAHSVFLSQAHKPIKGIHKVVEALPIIARHYPDVKVYVAGSDFTRQRSLKDKLHFGAYANYVLHLMNSLGVRERFVFLGMLTEGKMAERFSRAHVFVCPSSIENSPNSLGEAQLVGTPVVASYVGGVPNMVEHGCTGLLYRFEEHEMMARCICRVFGDDELAQSLSEQGKVAAQKRHGREVNALRTLEIYKIIIDSYK